MCKKCWAVSAVLMLAVMGLLYKFVVSGNTISGSDGRIAIVLQDDEKNLVLTEMRAFLNSVQLISTGLVENDMKKVAENARAVGAAAQQAVPGSLIGKLPIEFKKLGFDTHGQFDMLAMDAEQLGDREHSLKQLSVLMQNCVGCHAGYRLITEPGH